MSEIVKGWIVPSDWTHPRRMLVFRDKQNGWLPVLVVGVEEWERKREAAELLLFNFLISYDSGGCCSPSTSTQEVEAHAARLAAAILGTNGVKSDGRDR